MCLAGAAAADDRQRNGESSYSCGKPDGDLRSLPHRPRWFVPRLWLAARLEQAHPRIPPLRQTDLIEQLGMLVAEALEVSGALHWQPSREVTLHHLIARDEIAIHRGHRRACDSRGNARSRRGR